MAWRAYNALMGDSRLLVLDTRSARAYADRHIRGSVCVELSSNGRTLERIAGPGPPTWSKNCWWDRNILIVSPNYSRRREEKARKGDNVWRRNDQSDEVKAPRNLADRRLNPRILNPQKAYPSNPRYFTKPIVKPRDTYREYTRSTNVSSSELGNRKTSQNISEKQDSFESFSDLDEPETETYLRKLLNARLAKTKPGNIQEFDEEDEEEDVEDEEDEEIGKTFKTPTYARRKYESEMPEKPSVNLNESSDEKALRKALKLRRRETQEVLKEHLMEGSLSLGYSQAVVDNMPGFVDHIMVQAVALKTEERYVTSTFIARARVCVAQTKLIDIVKYVDIIISALLLDV